LPKCSFDPLASQRANGVPLQIFADQAADNLRRIVGNQVEILDISISRLDYDDNTKSKINQLNAQRANTATTEQAVKTAEQNRKANEILANQPPQNRSVSIANCLNKSIEKGLNPAGCGPSTTARGSRWPPTPANQLSTGTKRAGGVDGRSPGTVADPRRRKSSRASV